MCAHPDHVLYHSKAVAENAVTLHTWISVGCGGMEPFPCGGDHWHIGHASKVEGDACKEANPPKARR